MRYCIYLEAGHDTSTDAHCTRTFAGNMALEEAILVFFVDILFPMVGYIHKRRLKFHQRLNGMVEVLDIFAFEWRQDFKGKEGFLSIPDVIRNLGHVGLGVGIDAAAEKYCCKMKLDAKLISFVHFSGSSSQSQESKYIS
jgi:hypothetical protein